MEVSTNVQTRDRYQMWGLFAKRHQGSCCCACSAPSASVTFPCCCLPCLHASNTSLHATSAFCLIACTGLLVLIMQLECAYHQVNMGCMQLCRLEIPNEFACISCPLQGSTPWQPAHLSDLNLQMVLLLYDQGKHVKACVCPCITQELRSESAMALPSWVWFSNLPISAATPLHLRNVRSLPECG